MQVPKLRHITWILILSSLCLLGIVSIYQLGEKMISSWQQLRLFKSQVERIISGPQTIAKQKLEMERLSLIVSRLQGSGKEVTDHLDFVEYLENSCAQNAVRLVTYPTEHIIKTSGYATASEDFALEGKLDGILEVLYGLEYTDRVGAIQSLQLSLERPPGVRVSQRLLIAKVKANRIMLP